MTLGDFFYSTQQKHSLLAFDSAHFGGFINSVFSTNLCVRHSFDEYILLRLILSVLATSNRLLLDFLEA